MIETARLRLRRFGEQEAEEPGFILQLLNEPLFVRHIGDRGVRSIEAASAYIAMGPVASYARHGLGLLRLELCETGESIGVCGLVKREGLEHPDLGYALLPAYRGQGFAAEAAAAVLAHARDVLELQCVLAITGPDNLASITLLSRLGFSCEGTTRLDPDGPDLKLYAWRPNR